MTIDTVIVDAAFRSARLTVTLTLAWVVVYTGIGAFYALGKDRERYPGRHMNLAVLQLALAFLLATGWNSINAWIAPPGSPFVPPDWLRLLASLLALSGGAQFISQTVTDRIPARVLFAIWIGLMAVIFTIALLASLIPSEI